MYQVIDRSGQAFGPVSLDTLRQWAIERRLTPDMVLVEQASGKQGPAGEMLLGLGVFPDPTPTAAPSPAVTPAPAQPEPQPMYQSPAPVVSYAYKGSTESGMPPMLQTRAVAFFIDFIFGMAVYGGLHELWMMMLVHVDYTTWSMAAYIDYLIIPITAVYFLVRDALFPGQSIGKRIAGLKVVSTKRMAPTLMHSVLRNITAAPLVLLPMALWTDYIAVALLAFAFVVETFMVMTQGRRLGDTLAFTNVVNV